ncbi:MAG TPA: OPT/YSL family transporter, partial [Thermoanaerobaculia bacterium]
KGYTPDLRVDPATLATLRTETLQGPQARTDRGTYHSWQKTDAVGGPAGRYLVNDAGVPVYLVDPGINGTHPLRPDGTKVTKYDAPKATLMSYIIKGILNRQLPWGLVLLGVMISIVLEMSGIPSLAFAVGVYLPLSSSSPIFIGGAVRWLVDKYTAKKFAGQNLTEEQLTAEGDKSPGVLMASGYIAGGAIAGILIAISQGWLTDFDARMLKTMATNPFFAGGYSDLLALIPFAVLTVLLYLAGREAILAHHRSAR